MRTYYRVYHYNHHNIQTPIIPDNRRFMFYAPSWDEAYALCMQTLSGQRVVEYSHINNTFHIYFI